MDPILARFAAVALVLLCSALAGAVWRRRDGRVTVAAGTATDHRPDLGLDPSHTGPQAVLFGSPTCAPCDTVKSILRDVEGARSDFRWSYVDAADRLDLADAHSIRRVPTLLVLDDEGAVVARSSGVPRKDELTAALPVPQAS